MNARQAGESLAAVRDVEARATQSPIPWVMIVAVGLVFGVGLGIMLAGHVWGLLFLLASMVLMVMLEWGNATSVRTAMKQDVQVEEKSWSWKRFCCFIAVYTVAYLGMQIYADRYPEGSTVVGIVGGIAAAAVMIAGYRLTWRKYH